MTVRCILAIDGKSDTRELEFLQAPRVGEHIDTGQPGAEGAIRVTRVLHRVGQESPPSIWVEATTAIL